MSEEKTGVMMMILTPEGKESKLRASTSVPSTEGLRETIERWKEKASQRCPDTIDIEEQIEADRDAD